MKRIRVIGLILAAVCLLAACGGVDPETEPAVVTEPPMIDIGGTLVAPDVPALDLTAMEFELERLVAAATALKDVISIELGVTELTGEEMAALQAAYPDAEISYSICLFGQTLQEDAAYLDASSMTADQTQRLLEVLPLLPELKEISFVNAEGICGFGIEDIPELDRIRQALPECYLRVSFDLFGQSVTSEDERIEYLQVEIGNEGVETVRAVLPYLQNCSYFLMDGCGVDDEIMAQLRADFPETKIVWRIWLTTPSYTSRRALRTNSYLTDTHRIRTVMVNDRNAYKLGYCTETKYLDVGHVEDLTTCEFLATMPDLEVCILAITGIRDISPLANHEKLEYLELFTTYITDLSPLESCPNIEHLNMSDMKLVRDITPLYSLTNLKRIRMIHNPNIPTDQIKEFQARVPGCQILNEGYRCVGGGWRTIDGKEVERYTLLRQQLEYDIDRDEYGIH